jgi:hypothetical protein
VGPDAILVQDPKGGRKPINAKAESVARLPTILEPTGYERWLGLEPDPHDLLITYPSELMMLMIMWPISTRVNKPENDDPSVLDRVADPHELWAPLDGRTEDRTRSA